MNAGDLPPFTVSQLADFIASDPAERARVVRRLRHLTMIGALRPLGETHTGAGRHRLYAPDATAVAAVLVALGDMGLSVGLLKQAANCVELSAALPPFRERWQAAIEGAPMYFILKVTSRADREAGEAFVHGFATVGPEKLATELSAPGAVGAIVLDLPAVFGAKA